QRWGRVHPAAASDSHLGRTRGPLPSLAEVARVQPPGLLDPPLAEPPEFSPELLTRQPSRERVGRVKPADVHGARRFLLRVEVGVGRQVLEECHRLKPPGPNLLLDCLLKTVNSAPSAVYPHGSRAHRDNTTRMSPICWGHPALSVLPEIACARRSLSLPC